MPRIRAGATPPSLQFLQAAAGNAAVARMLARPASPRPATSVRPTPSAPQAPMVARTPEATGPEPTSAEPDTEPAVEPDQPAGSSLSIEAAAPPPPADPSDGNGGAPAVQRKVTGADFPGAGLILDAVRTIPGYQLMAQITGEDPITGDKVTTGRAEFVQSLLGFGPFAGAVGPVLQAVDALDSIFTLVQSRLGQHNLTLARIEHDIGAAWAEVHVADGIDANVAVVRRYVAAFLADVRAFASAVATDVIAAVRAAAVTFATPLVQSPTIKPVWDLGTKVFHYDPLKGESVTAPTEEILADFLHLIGKDEALAQMRERGTLAQAAAWLNTQFATFAALQGQATTLFTDAWAAISPENLPHLVQNLHSLAQRAFSLLGQVGAFANTVLSKVVSLIKDALLGMLSERAHHTAGFTAMTVMLGKDPFTSAPVPRTPSNLIRAFITLLPNGDQVFEQLSQSGVIADAAGRIESEMVRLGISWEMVSGTFHALWDQLSLEDLLDPLGAFLRILNQFEEPLGRIVSFAATVLQVVIELILRLMNFPSELLGDIIAKAMAAIEDIKKDPIQFLTNIVQAMKQGVMGFLDKIGTYLLHGLTDWLFRGMRGMGIEPPKDVSLQSIITFVLQVLGVSEQTLWRKLEEKVGAPKVARIRASIDRMGQAWQFVRDVQERGIAAIWEFIQGQLTNLWDMILDKAKNWIMTEIIEKVTAKLLSMLDPTGIMAVVNSCIAFFDAIQSAIEYLREILQIVDEYVSTIASIARGDVAPGAKMLEDGLAQAVPVAIGFLANQVGLGNVPEKVAEILHGFQGVVDQALTWLIDQAWSMGQAALNAVVGGAPAANPDPKTADGKPAQGDVAQKGFDMDGESHTVYAKRIGGRVTIEMASSIRRQMTGLTVAAVKAEAQQLGLTSLVATIGQLQALLDAVEDKEINEKRTQEVEADMNAQLTNITAILADIGRTYQLKSLAHIHHASQWVTAEIELKPEYRGKRFRPRVYGGWDAQNRSRGPVRRDALADLGQKKKDDSSRWAKDPLFPVSTSYYCKQGDHLVDHATRTGRLTLDHRPSVLSHWNSRGNDSGYQERNDWFNGGGSGAPQLIPMCQSCNSELGADSSDEDDVQVQPNSYRVGNDFRGRDES